MENRRVRSGAGVLGRRPGRAVVHDHQLIGDVGVPAHGLDELLRELQVVPGEHDDAEIGLWRWGRPRRWRRRPAGEHALQDLDEVRSLSAGVVVLLDEFPAEGETLGERAGTPGRADRIGQRLHVVDGNDLGDRRQVWHGARVGADDRHTTGERLQGRPPYAICPSTGHEERAVRQLDGEAGGGPPETTLLDRRHTRSRKRCPSMEEIVPGVGSIAVPWRQDTGSVTVVSGREEVEIETGQHDLGTTTGASLECGRDHGRRCDLEVDSGMGSIVEADRAVDVREFDRVVDAPPHVGERSDQEPVHGVAEAQHVERVMSSVGDSPNVEAVIDPRNGRSSDRSGVHDDLVTVAGHPIGQFGNVADFVGRT
jgi:hypothetical protein